MEDGQGSTFSERTFQWKVEGKAFGWQANKQQIYPVVPLARKKILSDDERGNAWGYFWLSGQGRLLSDVCGAMPDVCRCGSDHPGRGNQQCKGPVTGLNLVTQESEGKQV